VLYFGKHKGATLEEVGATAEGLLYLDWLLVNLPDLSNRDRDAIESYLNHPAVADTINAALGIPRPAREPETDRSVPPWVGGDDRPRPPTDSELFTRSCDHILPFGKYKGLPIRKAAEDDEGLLYLDYMMGLPELGPETRDAIARYLNHPVIAPRVNAAIEKEAAERRRRRSQPDGPGEPQEAPGEAITSPPGDWTYWV
jgi:hypothetical protein